MKISAVDTLKNRDKADVLILPFWQGKKKAEAAGDFKEFVDLYAQPLEMEDFVGKEGQTLILYNSSGKKEPRLLLVGLGEKKKISDEVLRRAYAAVTKACSRTKLTRLNLFIPEEGYQSAITEGILLTNYHYLKLKSHSLKESPYSFIKDICFIGAQHVSLKKTEKIIDSVNFARDLVNGNADDINTDALVKTAEDLAAQFSKVKVHVLRKKELKKEGLGLLLAVSRGAVIEPALIILEYMGDPKSDPKSSPSTAIVGKGITYDTGGINLKPTGGLETMKCDMAGAAAVLGTVRAAAELGLKVNLLGVVAAAENAIGPESYKPGDVYISHSGKTVEISNTDAEGRLVLADALSYLQSKYRPARIIDLATLTGGVVIALGEEITGLFSNDEALATSLTQAGLKTHERLWRLPLLPEYKEKLKSTVADIKNSGSRAASSATAAIFLEQFVKETPWAHLDIAGTAYLSEPKTYHQTPATGVGVRLLIEFLSTQGSALDLRSPKGLK